MNRDVTVRLDVHRVRRKLWHHAKNRRGLKLDQWIKETLTKEALKETGYSSVAEWLRANEEKSDE